MNKQLKENLKVDYNTPGEFLWIYVLGGCGCGSGEYIAKRCWEIFSDIAENEIGKRKINLYDKIEDEIITHWIESKNLLEHGISINCSWLTEEGKELYDYLKSNTKKIS